MHPNICLAAARLAATALTYYGIADYDVYFLVDWWVALLV